MVLRRPRRLAPPLLWVVAAGAAGAAALGYGLGAGALSGYATRRAVAVAAAHGVVLLPRAAHLGWRGELVLEQPALAGRFGRLTCAELRVGVDLGALVGGALRPRAVRATGLVGRAAPPGPLPELDVELAALEVVRAPEHGAWRVAATTTGGGAIDGTIRRGAELQVELSLTRLAADDLPRALLDRLPAETRGLADGWLAFSRRQDGDGALALELHTYDLTLTDRRLSGEPVGPLPLAVALRARRAGEELLLDEATITYGLGGEATLRVAGRTARGPGAPLALEARLSLPDAARLVAALPPVLQPPLEAPALAGPFAGSLTLSGPRDEPVHWVVAAALDLSGLRAAARAGKPPALAGPFVHRPLGPDGGDGALEILVGPDNPDFVPLASLPPFVAGAVMVSEDGGFARHPGFDFAEIHASLQALVQLGRAVRGGSTITQQLAKNLFLTRQRTYARKVREALVTLAIEGAVDKNRLLEIYLNVVEWGPGIFGIGPAARAYFAKEPAALTPAEAALLASAIPNPLRRHAEWQRGELAPNRAARIAWILARLAERGLLAPETDTGLAALFGPLGLPLPADPLDQAIGDEAAAQADNDGDLAASTDG